MHQRNHHKSRHERTLTCLHAALLVSAIVMAHFAGCKTDGSVSPKNGAKSKKEATSKADLFDEQKIARQVDRFCGDCHGTPPPSGFAKSDWQEEVENGFRFYLESGRSDLEVPIPNDIIRYYRMHAPDALELPAGVPANDEFTSLFKPTAIGNAPEQTEFTAHVEVLKLPAREDASLVMTGLRQGSVAMCNLDGSDFSVITTLTNPARFSQADVDGDGHDDLLVADLGSFKPLDHELGKVVWLRWNDSSSQYEQHVILDKIGRTADVQPGDFDGDGDLDLVVAEFGWKKTGGTWLLINNGPSEEGAAVPVKFERRKIDIRHGPINVPVVDFDKDGDLDFVLLLGQEHEAVILFENTGDNIFKKQTLFTTGDPSYGSSGLQPVDIDGDGDLDFLYANGDSFDRYYIKPFHGVRVLENTGDLEFKEHMLAFMPGAHRAMPIDFDNDGDLDIVAVANLPEDLNRSQIGTYDSVVLFRNEGGLNFLAGMIQEGRSSHATVAVGDFDDDGDTDFATADRSQSAKESRLTVWWNERK